MRISAGSARLGDIWPLNRKFWWDIFKEAEQASRK
jgi:hypothetical protein